MEITSKKSESQIQKQLVEKEVGPEVFKEAHETSLDLNLLEMARNIHKSSSKELFDDQLKSFSDKLAYDLRLCRYLLTLRDAHGLDQLAQQMTQNALLIGAQKILKTAVDLQSLARMEYFDEIELIVGEMEQELLLVKEEILQCS